jgi:hypothetical protein
LEICQIYYHTHAEFLCISEASAAVYATSSSISNASKHNEFTTASKYGPQNAIDGDVSTNLTFFQSRLENDPWLKIVFAREIIVREVHIYHRLHKIERFQEASVTLQGNTGDVQCGDLFKGPGARFTK